MGSALDIGYKPCPRCPSQRITLITQATENIWSEDCPYCGFNFGKGAEGAMREKARPAPSESDRND